jgi:cytochrome c556
MMRTIPVFVISALLFVVGIGFVVVGARAARQQPAAPAVERAALVPVATVKQIMAGIVGPGAGVVFDSVSTTVSAAGVEEKAPGNDQEWAVVGNSAAALAEAGNLLMMDGRAVDRADWMKMSQAMIDAARQALKAVDAKSADGILEVGDKLNQSCDTCHERYQRQ